MKINFTFIISKILSYLEHLLKVSKVQRYGHIKISLSAKIFGGSKILVGDRSTIHPGVILDCSENPFSHNKLCVKNFPGQIIIGENSSIRNNSFLFTYGGKIVIGDNCSLNPNCFLQGAGGIDIGNQVRIGPNVSLIASEHNFADSHIPIMEQGVTSKGINIGNDVWIGAGVIILDGVEVGSGAVIGAGSVVTSDVEPNSVMVGVPAKKIKSRIN